MAIERITKFSDAIQPTDIINEVVDVVNNADLEEFVGASESQAGKKGIVPAPEAGSNNRYLSSDGTWKQVTMPTIASKEDAQTGTDNTKMMTPLRTVEAIKKQRPLITFTSFSQIGLPNTLTWLDFINKMKELAYTNWELITWVSNGEDGGYPNLELPYEHGGFLFMRGSATGSFVAQLSNHNNNDLYIASCVGSENKIKSWTKISNKNIITSIDGISAKTNGQINLFDILHRYPNNYVPTDTSNNGWNNLGICSIYYSNLDVIANQPTQYGQLINIPAQATTESTQLWIAQNGGDIYYRGGNGTKPINETAFIRVIGSNGGTITGNLTVIGTITGTKVIGAVYNDYAEFFPRGEETEAGDIIMLNPNSEEEKYIKASTSIITEYPLVVGVHSEEYSHLIGGELPENGEDFYDYNIDKYIPVGLAGRCKVKIKGKAIKGAPVTISDTPGVGICSNNININSIVGYLVESDNIEDENTIRLLKVKLK